MPASNVSLSNISVAPMASAAPAVGASGGGALQAGPGAERSFGQWMQQMQSAGGSRRQTDGESLPEGGKTLPAQRQAEGAQADAEVGAAQADRAVGSEHSHGTEQAEVTEANVRSVQPDAEPGEGQLQAEGDEAEEMPPNAASEEVLDLEVEEGAQAVAGDDAGGKVDPEEADVEQEGAKVPVDIVADAEPPAESVRSDVGEGQQVVAESGRPESGSQAPGLVAGDSTLSDDVDQAGVASRAASDSPGRGARAEVREAALQNRGRTGETESASPDRHGRQVSAVARSGAQAGESAGPVEPVDGTAAGSGERGESAATGVQAVVTMDSEASTNTNEPTSVGESQAADPVAAVAAADSAVATVVVEEGHNVAAVTAAVPQPDAADRAQSARDTVAKAGPAQAPVLGARQSVATQTGGETGAGGGQHGSGAQSESRGGNPFADLPQTGAAAADRGASARHDADLQSAGRAAATQGGDARVSTESATATVGTSAQVTQATAGAVMTSSAAMQRLQDPAWGRAMGQRAIMMAQYGPRTAEIQLDPPELGAMQIRIHLGAQDQVSVSFSSPHPAVRDAIEQQMPRLREMFAEQGLELGQSSVSDQSANGGGDGSSQARGRGGSGNYADPDGGAETPVNLQSVPVGLVDYYA